MSREVRWIIQVTKKDVENWIDRPDLTYTGWFYSDGEDKETSSLIRDYDEAVADHPWLYVRIIKDVRSMNVASAYRGKMGVIRTNQPDPAEAAV